MFVRVSTLSNFNISESRGPIANKFDLEDHLGGVTALVFGPDRIKIPVPMATDSSHRVIMGGNLVRTQAPSLKSRMSSKFGPI